MKSNDKTDCVAIIRAICPVILSTVPTQKGKSSSELRRLVGILYTEAEALLEEETLNTSVRDCLDAARLLGATVTTMGRVRLAALAQTRETLATRLTVQMFVRLSLAQEARIAAAMTFTSFDDCNAVSDAMMTAFGDAADEAADDTDTASYRAIVALRATLAYHFSRTGRVLPRLVTTTVQTSLPSLTLSQLIYSTGARSDELHQQNKAIHPAFMPLELKALSA